ncbi:MAG TPA: aldose epimerase family protein [Gemmatimonadales bacterium]|nr:aldose epimerase family protein [Gemmatimonadales bacterium]
MEIFTLTNAAGLTVRVTEYGGIIMSILAPDREGRLANVVLGHDSPEEYRKNPHHLGAIIGRVAGRIAGARFTLDGTTYQLPANLGQHHLHGGRGFDQVVWRAVPFRASTPAPRASGVALDYTSPDGEEGYPGTLSAHVNYTLTHQNELIVDYRATTDRATPVNLTQHSYFNLAGRGDILGHLLQIDADKMLLMNEAVMPTGQIVAVAGTPFDFRTPSAVGARIAQPDEQLRRAGGYDHSFVLETRGLEPVHAARVVEPSSGRTLDVSTTEPSVHFYSGNGIGRAGLCLETQHFPDSPNRPEFPSIILRPGREYRSRTIFAFAVAR